jgi:hypothetical protein
MAEDSRPPPPDKQSGALPRRVPATGGLTPAQIRRGFLAPGTSQPANCQNEPANADTGVRPELPRAQGLPRRVPGSSAIHRPPPAGQADTDAASAGAARATVSPEQMAASAARLLRPKTGFPKSVPPGRDASAQTSGTAIAPADATVAPRAPAAAADAASGPQAAPPPDSQPTPASVGTAARPPAVQPARASPAARAPRPAQVSRRRSSRRARRWQLAGLLVVIAAVLAVILTIALAHRHSANPPGSARSVSGNRFSAGGGPA